MKKLMKKMKIMKEDDEDDDDEPVSSTTPMTSLSSRFEALKIIIEYIKSENNSRI